MDAAPAPQMLEIWPENLPAVQVFLQMRTQWVLGGMSGRRGLCYESLPVVMRYAGIKKRQRAAAFAGVRIMEQAVMEVIDGQ